MRSILLLICCAGFIQSFAFGHLDLNEDGQLIGVSQKRLEDYMIKAIEGFRKMMPKGDEEMNYPVMDPFDVEDASWNYVDKSETKKYQLNFFNKNKTILQGLSNFEFSGLKVDAKEMSSSVQLTFKNLQTEFPYKLSGHMFKNFMPVYGEGIIKISAPSQTIDLTINLATEQSYIVVEKVRVFRRVDDINIQATGLMDLPDEFANLVLGDILNSIVKQHDHSVLSDFAHNVVEEAVGGMTTNELFEFLDHFVKKSDQ